MAWIPSDVWNQVKVTPDEINRIRQRMDAVC